MSLMRVPFGAFNSRRFAMIAMTILTIGGPINVLAEEPAITRRRVARASARAAMKPVGPREFEKTQELEALRQFVFRSRDLQSWLQTAKELVRSGQRDEALAYFHLVWTHQEDSFILTADQHFPVGARDTIRRLFEELPPAVWHRYEVMYGAAAKRKYQFALESTDIQAINLVSRDYFFTASGFEATNRLASWWADHGNHEAAARCWDRLLNSQVHARRVKAVHRVKAAVAYRRCGREEDAEAVMSQASVMPAIAGERSHLDDPVIKQAIFQVQAKTADSTWPMVMGSPNRIARRQHASLPYLRPLWKHKFYSSIEGEPAAHAVDDRIEDWAKNQRDNGLPTAVANYPIAVGNQLILRDRSGIRVLNASTGETTWTYDCLTSYIQMEENRPRSQQPPYGLWVSSNANWGMLSSDGERVFAIDDLELTWNPPRVHGGHVVVDPTRERRQKNQLIALPLAAKGQIEKPIWTAGGHAPQGEPAPRLEGHFFLGPPLPLHGQLFVVSEYQHQIRLSALNPADGHVRWSQSIALVDLSIDQDRNRYLLPCTPSYAQGVLVCPTQLGVVVGVDETTGSLLWVYYYGDPLPEKQFGRMPFRRYSMHGHSGYPDLPLISDDHVVTMPRQSEQIHCFHLRNGHSRWRAPRDGAEYVGTIDDDVVLVVGRNKCRGLSLQSGDVLWETKTGICSGRGVQTGDSYVLPLDNGSVANLDIATGRKTGLSYVLAHDQIGNLAVHEGMILSVTHDRVSAYPQTEPHLRNLHQKIEQNKATGLDLLQAGELDLILGRIASSKSHLHAALGEDLTAEDIADAEVLLREALMLQLKSPSTEERELLAELNHLSRTPKERARYLILLAEYELRGRHYPEAVAAALEFADLRLNEPIPLSPEANHWVTQGSWIPGFLTRLESEVSYETAAWLHAQIGIRLNQAAQARNREELHRFIINFTGFEEADAARLALAELELEEGHFQTAELLLRRCREAGSYKTAAAATWALANLYADRFLYAQSLEMARELGGKYRYENVTEDLTGLEAMLQLGMRDNTYRASLELAAGSTPVTHVSIQEDQSPQLDLQKVYSNFWHPVKIPYECGYELRPTGKRRPNNEMWVFHRWLGMEMGVLQLPSGAILPTGTNGPNSFAGHFFSLGSKHGGAMFGVSLLDSPNSSASNGLEPALKQVLWTTVVPSLAGSESNVRPGPTGNGFCTFQTPQHLLMLDPATGQIRWQRSDIQPGGGLFTDTQTGLFGDERVVVMMGRDKQSFTVYDTVTGDELADGKLNIETNQPRRVIGRNYLYIAEEGDLQFLRIWDPLTDELLCNEPIWRIEGRTAKQQLLMVPVEYSNSLAFLSAEAKGLRILDGETGEIELDIPLEEELASQLRQVVLFRDDERLYVNLQHHHRSTWHNHSFAGETELAHVRINGELRVYSRKDRSLLWSRNIPQCTIPRIADFAEPVFITLSRISWRGRYFLQVSAYDANTGELLGSRRDVASHRIVHAAYDPMAKKLQLRSLKNKITLQLRNQPLLEGDDVQLAKRPQIIESR